MGTDRFIDAGLLPHSEGVCLALITMANPEAFKLTMELPHMGVFSCIRLFPRIFSPAAPLEGFFLKKSSHCYYSRVILDSLLALFR